MVLMTKSKLLPALGIACVLACVCVIYGLGLSNELVFDDARLTDGTILGQYGSLLKIQPRMLSYGSFAWLQPLLGEGYAGQRVLNALLHLATCAAIWLLVSELFKHVQWSEESLADPDFARNQRIAIFAGVALFAVHPVAVYAVGYLLQRSTVMLTLFSALACWAYVKALGQRSWLWAAAALVCTVLALMSKEYAVVLPGLALPLYVFVKRPGFKTVALVTGGATLLLAVLAAMLWSRFGVMVGAAAFDETSGAYLHQLEQAYPGIASRVYPLSVMNQAAQFFHYGLLWWLPNVQWMAMDLRPVFPVGFTTMPQLAGALCFVVLVVAGAVLLLRRRDAWGLVGLVVVATAMLFATEFITTWLQDPFVLYRSYLWAMFLPALFALVLLLFSRRVMVALACGLCLVLSVLAAERVVSLKNPETAWGDAAEKVDLQAPFNAFGRWRPFLNRGVERLEKLNYEQALKDFDTAVALGEPLGSAQFNRGMTLELLKRYPEAVKAFAAAEKLGFKNAALPYHEAVSYKAMQQLEPAFQSYAKALAMDPPAELRGRMLVEQAEVAIPAGHYDAAIANYRQLLQAQPTNPRYVVGLGIAHIGKKEYGQAMQIFDESLARQPNPPALYGKALVYREQGNAAAAIDYLTRASAMDPANPLYKGMLQQLRAGGTAGK